LTELSREKKGSNLSATQGTQRERRDPRGRENVGEGKGTRKGCDALAATGARKSHQPGASKNYVGPGIGNL